MKKISFIIILIFSIYSYAKADDFQEIQSAMSGPCEYITEDGKNEKLGEYMYSNLCAEVYKTDIDNLDNAYIAYKKYIKNNQGGDNIYKHLPDKAPEKRKDKNKIHIRLKSNGADYNILFEKKDDGVYVYSHLGLISEKDSIGEAKAEYESDKLKYYETRSVLIGENLKNTVSGVVIQKAYSLKENIYYHIYEVNTLDIDEAYKIINEFRNEKYNTNYPLTLDKNKNTERINSNYVTTDYDVMEVGIDTLELKKQGNKVVGIVEITGN